ncbi:MAG: LytR C-terminal domain-containing protein, partial [Thermodesulfovibrionales bacterium]|nr:LytR C-terminal domain-containing protein [Thermodesulfovibrionales bacterium]
MPERIRQGAERVGQKLESIEDKLERLEREYPASVRVKVLRGDGVPGSAQEAAALLRERGYDVGGVGVAPSEGFEADTVFFSEGFEAAAGAIAGELGEGARTRPLTWSSVYDVIVVTGGNTGGN